MEHIRFEIQSIDPIDPFNRNQIVDTYQ